MDNKKALNTIKTKTYFLDNYFGLDFYIDIVSIIKSDSKIYECYIYSDTYLIKELIFGMDQNEISFYNFKQLAIKNAKIHIPQYEIDYRC